MQQNTTLPCNKCPTCTYNFWDEGEIANIVVYLGAILGIWAVAAQVFLIFIHHVNNQFRVFPDFRRRFEILELRLSYITDLLDEKKKRESNIELKPITI